MSLLLEKLSVFLRLVSPWKRSSLHIIVKDRPGEAATCIPITVDLLRHRQLIEDNFDNVYDEVFGDIFKPIRLNRIHMAYNEQANKLGYAKVLDKHTLENYFTSEPYYVEETNNMGKRKKVRFSGSAGPSIAHIFRYDDLGINLMSDPTREENF